jgi:ABC-type Na+ transport system ATPase subunit NatA
MRSTIEMALEAGFSLTDDGIYIDNRDGTCDEEVKRLVELARADEREACAKVADEYANGLERNYSENIADAIRARGETK